jgi:hypothetical protein
MSMIRHSVAVVGTLLPLAASAQEPATGAALRAAIAGNTIYGNSIEHGDEEPDSSFAEYYAEDGTLRAAGGYTATWTIIDDMLCFDYGDGPGCWDVWIKGNAVTMDQGGAQTATGTIVAGKPNNY